MTGSAGQDSHKKSCYFALAKERVIYAVTSFEKVLGGREPLPPTYHSLSVTERKVIDHFKENPHQDVEGGFIVPLSLKPDAAPLGES